MPLTAQVLAVVSSTGRLCCWLGRAVELAVLLPAGDYGHCSRTRWFAAVYFARAQPGVLARTPGVPDRHHGFVRCSRPDRARVH